MKSKPLRVAVLYVAIITAAAVLYLFSPPPRADEHYCGATMHLGRLLTLNINCDSIEFIDEAIDPAILLRHVPMSRQERPLFILSASLLTHLLMATDVWRMVPAHAVDALNASSAFKSHYEKHHVSLEPKLYWKYVLAAYISYVLINAGLLLVALLLFHWLAVGWSPNAIVAGYASLLLANDTVKAFFWSAHTVMFTFVVPLGCVLLCQKMLRHSYSGVARTGAIGLVTGILSLAYGSFAIWLVAGVAALALSHRPITARLSRGLVLESVTLILGFALPIMLWISTCKIIGEGYSNGEIEQYHQFIWLLDSARLGFYHLLLDLLSHGVGFLEFLLPVTLLPVLLLGFVVFGGFVFDAPLRLIVMEESLVFTSICVTTAACILFFYLMGFYQTRLELGVVVPILLAEAILTVRINERAQAKSPLPIAGLLVWGVTLACMAYEIAKPFPPI